MNLDGIRVLDCTQLLPGPFGSQLLADMGAEVIKIEPPEGEPARQFQALPGWPGYVFTAVNNGKRSVTLDLKQDRGRQAFYDLAETADVVFEQFRPGVAARLGIDYDTLCEYNEDLVYCSLTGYGQAGPYRDRAGHDLNYVGFAGLTAMTRESSDGDPVPPGYPIADMAGGLMAATSIVSALLSRELGNESGQYIDLSMTDAVLSLGQVEVAMASAGEDPQAGGTPIAGAYPWYDVYETSDGEYVTLAALEPRFWQAFCEAVDREDLVQYHMTQDEEERAWLREELASLFAEQTQAAWEDHLADHPDSMFGLVKRPAEAINDPHLTERGIFTAATEAHKRVAFPGLGDEAEAPTDCPALGEDTTAVLTACGYDEDTLETLAADGVI